MEKKTSVHRGEGRKRPRGGESEIIPRPSQLVGPMCGSLQKDHVTEEGQRKSTENEKTNLQKPTLSKSIKVGVRAEKQGRALTKA